MATSNRDVKLTVEAQALGGDSIKTLAAQIRALGKSGSDAAPEFNRLAGELDKIGEQAAAVLGLRQLQAQVESLAAAQANAAQIAEGTASAYNAQKAATDVLRAAVAKTTDDWNAARLAQIAAREALDAAKRETEALTTKEKARNTGLQEAKRNLSEATAEQRRLKVALDEANDSLSAAAEAEREAGSEYRKTAADLTRAETALRERSSALKDAETAASKLGVETTDLAAAEATLRAALTDTARAAESTHQALLKLAEATEQAAEADRVAARAQQALDGIRKAAYQQDQAAKVKAEAEATRDLAVAQAQAERVQTALANIRKTAYQQDQAAQVKAEAAAQREHNAQAAQAERIQTALANIRKAAYQQDQADKIKAEAAALAKLKAEAEAAGAALGNAFATVGVRSVQAIQTEIDQTRRALGLLEQRFAAGEVTAYDMSRAVGAAQARLQALNVELRAMPAAAGAFERMNAATLDLATRFGAISAALATVGYAAKPILDANLALDSMRRVLTTVYGSAEQAALQIDFVRRVAEQSGLSVQSLGESFTRFAASAKASGIDAGLVRQVFEATANAAGNLGLSTDKTTHILDALSQMANKGTVSMEELRQQLGDSLPGALSLLAKGLGITEPQLVKLVESGKLLTSEALGPLAQAMTALAAPGGRVEGLRAALSRLGNEFTLAFQKISDTSAYKGLTSTIGFLADNFGALTTGVKLSGEAMLASKVVSFAANLLQMRAATTATAVATVEATAATATHTAAVAAETTAVAANTAAKTANNAATAGSIAGLASAGAAAASNATSVGLFAAAMSRLGAIASTAFAAIGGWVGVLAVLALNLDKVGEGFTAAKDKVQAWLAPSDKARESFRGLERGAQQAAEAVATSGESMVRAKVIYAEQADALAKATAAAEKNAQAAKLLGDASIVAAEMSGNEAAKLEATALARQREADALDTVAAAKRAESALTAGLIEQTERSIAGKGRLGDVQQRELDQLVATRDLLGQLSPAQDARLQSLIAQQAEAEKALATTREQIVQDKLKLAGQQAATAEAEAAAVKQRQLAEAAALVAQTTKDNTSNYQVFRQEVENATLTLQFLRNEMAAGRATSEQVDAATRRLAVANGLLKDSIEDTARTSEAWTARKRADADLTRANLQLAREEQQSILRFAELHGNETQALQAKIKIKELDLRLARDGAEAKATEANEVIRSTQELIRELDAAGQLTPVKREELELRILNAKAKLAEAKAGGEAAKSIEAEIQALKGLGAAKRAASGSSPSGGGVPANEDQRGRAAAGIDGAGNSNPANQRDEFGRTPRQREFMAGQGGPVDASYIFQLRDRLNRGDTFQASELPAIENALRAAMDNQRLSTASTVPDLKAQRDDAAWIATLRQVRDRAAGQALGGSAVPAGSGAGQSLSGPSAAPAAAPSAAAAPAASSPRTVNINLGGLGSTSINVASDADAAKVEAVLRQLETAMARAGG